MKDLCLSLLATPVRYIVYLYIIMIIFVSLHHWFRFKGGRKEVVVKIMIIWNNEFIRCL